MQTNKKFFLVTKEWLELKKMSVKYSSYVKYETVILKHIIPFFDDYTIEQINDDIIVSFFKDICTASTLFFYNYILPIN